MALTTYSELKTAVANFLNRDDLTSVIADFVTLAEAQIQRDLRHWRMEARTTATASSQYTALPSDFLEPIRLHLQGKDKALEPMSVNEMQDRRYDDDDTAGVPTHYALTAGQIELWPTPGDSYTLEIYYRADLAVLSDSNTSNWLLSEAPDVYLYGTLVQSAPYLVDDARLLVWKGLYADAIAKMQASSDRAKFGSNLKLRW